MVIGAVLTAGAARPSWSRASTCRRMKPGSVLVDVSIDQGGCFETSHPTTHADPTYTSTASSTTAWPTCRAPCRTTSAEALNNATLPFGLKLADNGLDAFDRDPHLAAGLNVKEGRIMHQAVALSLGFDRLGEGKVLPLAAE